MADDRQSLPKVPCDGPPLQGHSHGSRLVEFRCDLRKKCWDGDEETRGKAVPYRSAHPLNAADPDSRETHAGKSLASEEAASCSSSCEGFGCCAGPGNKTLHSGFPFQIPNLPQGCCGFSHVGTQAPIVSSHHLAHSSDCEEADSFSAWGAEWVCIGFRSWRSNYGWMDPHRICNLYETIQEMFISKRNADLPIHIRWRTSQWGVLMKSHL